MNREINIHLSHLHHGEANVLAREELAMQARALDDAILVLY